MYLLLPSEGIFAAGNNGGIFVSGEFFPEYEDDGN